MPLSQRWIQLHAGGGTAGPAGPVGPAGSAGTPAPNVTSATATPCYKSVDYGQVFGFTGVITLPTGDPNYSHLKHIDVVGIDPTGASYIVVSFDSWSGSTIDYTGFVNTQPTTNQGWKIDFVCYNEYGSPTGSPYEVTGLTVY